MVPQKSEAAAIYGYMTWLARLHACNKVVNKATVHWADSPHSLWTKHARIKQNQVAKQQRATAIALVHWHMYMYKRTHSDSAKK